MKASTSFFVPFLLLLWGILPIVNADMSNSTLSTSISPNQSSAHVDYISDFQNDQQLQINAKVSIHLSAEIKTAIQHEVPIRFKTDIMLLKKWSLLGMGFYYEKKNASYETELHYFKYTRTYALVNFRNKHIRRFKTLQDALYTLGNIDGFPVTSLDQLHPDNHYQLKLRLTLNPWKLPAPLILTALTSPKWHLESPWFIKPIQAPSNWN